MMNNSWSGDRTGFPKAMRAKILRRDKTCRICGLRPATEADHIVSVAECRRLGIVYDTIDNGQGLCRECHWAKTRAEIQQGQARMRTPKRIPVHPSQAPRGGDPGQACDG